jgi:hypothetical protein
MHEKHQHVLPSIYTHPRCLHISYECSESAAQSEGNLHVPIGCLRGNMFEGTHRQLTRSRVLPFHLVSSQRDNNYFPLGE